MANNRDKKGKTKPIEKKIVKQLQIIITILNHFTLKGNNLPLYFISIIVNLIQY